VKFFALNQTKGAVSSNAVWSGAPAAINFGHFKHERTHLERSCSHYKLFVIVNSISLVAVKLSG